MYIDNEPEPVAGNNATTREIVDAIYNLIEARAVAPYLDADRIEVLKRFIADGLKTHSAARGVVAQ